MPIIDRSYYGAAQRGRDDRQQEQTNALMNRARALDVNQGEYVNTLMRDQNTTPEQFARTGRSDVANSIANISADKAAQAREWAKQVRHAAEYSAQAPQGQTKAFIERNFPFLVETYGPEWATASDDQVRQELQGIAAKFGAQAGIGPATSGETFTLSPGQTRFGPDGKPIASIAPQPDNQNVNEQLVTRPAGPGLVQDFAWNPRSRSMVPVGQPYKPATTHTGNPTEGERGAANYFERMQAAEGLLDPQFVPTIPQFMASRKQMEGGPLASSIANKFLDEKTQKYYQAAADWVRAKLRKESGAAIGVQEMEQEIKTYFPLPGDTPAVVAQKAAARQQAIQGMRGMGGRAIGAESQKEITATGPNGQKIVLRNGQWVPL
jgi:hypothetical protein